MASVSLHVDGEVRFEPWIVGKAECHMVLLESWCDEGRRIPYSRDCVTLHGTVEQVRAFLLAGLAALPPVVPPQPAAEQAEPEPLIACGCEVPGCTGGLERVHEPEPIA